MIHSFTVCLLGSSSPYINRFLQPDSIIPSPSNPQSWNRFSYVVNNPLRYVDPTGHKYNDCEGLDDVKCKHRMQHLGKVFEQQVAQTVADLKKKLEQEFQWYVIGTGWSLIELQTIYQVGLDIQNYIDVKGLTNGNAWILQNLGNTNFVHASWGDSHAVTLPKFPGGATVKLGKTWLNDPIWTPNELVAHELGHVWDIHTGLAASADLIDDLGGGSVWFFGKPVNAPQWNPRVHNVGSDAYGNLQRNDYFAEAFSVTIYSPTLTPPGVSTWIDANISNPAFASVLTVDPSDPVP